MDNYARHMFTPNVIAEQDSLGVVERFKAAYRNRFTGDLDEDARAFFESRTSFYMASVGETGWPYVQHRGGPKGFLKVIDGETVGFADYSGNKQLISKGNFVGNDRVALILMDYPRRARLKVIGHASMIDAGDDPELATTLAVSESDPIERLTTIRLTAIDWNCPKYIEPRYSEDEVAAIVAPHLAKRDAVVEALSERLRALGEDPDKILPGSTHA